VGEVWRCACVKTVLLVAGEEAKEACGIDQLYAGLKAGIEGDIHAINKLWQEMKEEEDWGFLLIDASNAFNELNRTAMLWHVRHEWPSGAQYSFNCYRHWSTLVIQGVDGASSTFIHCKVNGSVWDRRSAANTPSEKGVPGSNATMVCRQCRGGCSLPSPLAIL
jgi:hypothetical protein